MKPVRITLIALAVTGMLGNGPVVLADNTNDKPFEGVVVEDIVVMEQLPDEVESGSIRVRDDSQRAMAKQATISSNVAAAIATRAQPGTVTETELKEAEGFLVWKVEIVDREDREIELMIDAGNGRLLAADNDDDKEHWSWEFWKRSDKDK